jgi:hypothetical protein
MRVLADDRLRDEAARFTFRHTCDHCCHFAGRRCGNGWPIDGERRDDDDEVVFCKEFEMA